MERTFSPMIRQYSAIDGLQQAYTLAAESEELLHQDDRVAAIDKAIHSKNIYKIRDEKQK